jgi:hypothetical protein
LNAEFSNTSLLSEHNTHSEYHQQQSTNAGAFQNNNNNASPYQQYVSTTTLQHVPHGSPNLQNASTSIYNHVVSTTTSNHPSSELSENPAASLMSDHNADDVVNLQQEEEFERTGRQLRRFYFRTTVWFVGPIIVVGYLVIIWQYYLAPLTSDSFGAFGPPGAK